MDVKAPIDKMTEYYWCIPDATDYTVSNNITMETHRDEVLSAEPELYSELTKYGKETLLASLRKRFKRSSISIKPNKDPNILEVAQPKNDMELLFEYIQYLGEKEKQQYLMRKNKEESIRRAREDVAKLKDEISRLEILGTPNWVGILVALIFGVGLGISII